MTADELAALDALAPPLIARVRMLAEARPLTTVSPETLAEMVRVLDALPELIAAARERDDLKDALARVDAFACGHPQIGHNDGPCCAVRASEAELDALRERVRVLEQACRDLLTIPVGPCEPATAWEVWKMNQPIYNQARAALASGGAE